MKKRLKFGLRVWIFMKKLQVITISSRDPHEPYYFKRQFDESAKRQGITPHYLQELPWGGLMTKPKSLLKYLAREGSNFDYVVVVDAWDILFLGDVEELLSKFSLFDAPIVFNAERSCFPRADLAEKHPLPVLVSPYRYLNSGFFMGKTEDVVTMLRAMQLENVEDDYVKSSGEKWEPNDQLYYQLYYLDNIHKIDLDTQAMLCQSLHGSEPDEFAFAPATKRVMSLTTGNQPTVFHGNGSGKEWLKKIIGWLHL